MAEVTAAAVKSLRERTDLPMMKCKKALVEAGGDEEKAIALLKEEMSIKVKSRSDNECNEGQIFILEGNGEVAAVEFRCESEPVSKFDDFVALGDAMVKQLLEGPGAASGEELLSQPHPDGGTIKDKYDEVNGKIQEKFDVSKVARHSGPAGVYLHHDRKSGAIFLGQDGADTDALKDVAMHIAAMKPLVMTREEADPAKVAEEREKLVAEAKASGKPDNIVERIVDGRMTNFYKEEAGVLLDQPFAKDDSKSVSQFLKEKGIEPRGFELFKIGG